MDSEQMSITEAATALGRNPEHVRRLVRERSLEGTKLGKQWLVSRRSVEAYKQGGRVSRLKLACAWTALVTDAAKAPELERLLRATFSLTDAEAVDLLAAWRQMFAAEHKVAAGSKQPVVLPPPPKKGTAPSAARALGMAAGVAK